jgi:hypothetical protein
VSHTRDLGYLPGVLFAYQTQVMAVATEFWGRRRDAPPKLLCQIRFILDFDSFLLYYNSGLIQNKHGLVTTFSLFDAYMLSDWLVLQSGGRLEYGSV